MRAWELRHRLTFIPSLATLLLTVSLTVHCERLPLKAFTNADGLAGNSINKIVRDSRGFLWFCTEEGLSRYDGYNFVNYTTEQGLPQSGVNDILETRSGEYWIATNGGLVHFNPKGTHNSNVTYANDSSVGQAPMFTAFLPEDTDRHARAITVLLEARDGTIWCGTYKGLYKLDSQARRLVPVEVGMPYEYGEWLYVTDIVEDQFESLWIATHGSLYRRWKDGTAARYTRHDGLPDDVLHDLLIDHQQQLWVGSRNKGFYRLTFDQTHATPKVAFTLTPGDYSQSEWINQLFETSEHRLWAATARGLLEFIPDGNSQGHYHVYTPQNGLTGLNLTAIAEDDGGNLWLGSENGAGVMKLAHNGFITYGREDGIVTVNAVFPDRAGGVCVRGYVLGDKQASIFDGGRLDLLNLSNAYFWPRFGRFDGQHFNWFVPNVLKGKDLGWVSEGTTLQDPRSGEWWLGTPLYRFPSLDNFTQLKTAQLTSHFGKGSIIGDHQIWRLFEDSRGRIWVSIIDFRGNGLAVWEPENQNVRDLNGSTNLPSLHDDLPRAFGEDRLGNIWIGFNTGLALFHDGSFNFYTDKDGLPPGAITEIFTDHSGRLWLGSARGGLVLVENGEADRPHFKTYTTEQGLSGNLVLALAEDTYGRIYVGTGQGLDRFDPTSGHVRHYSAADGLAGGKIFCVYLAKDGWIWIGTTQGISRFLPEPETILPAPPVMFTTLNVAGNAEKISALGETNVQLSDLASSASQLQINFVGLSFVSGGSLRYQYKLEGADRDWSVPTSQRTVTYAHLAAGRYRFLVRAVNADGQVSAVPAVITFRVLPALWLRWWFIAIAVLLAASLVYWLYRYRVSRLLEVANMRTRIATDLHDDIGSNLTKIAILSEVAKQQQVNHEKDEGPLTSIAQISRESVSAMSDIVWAINPNRDHLIDVIRRMRRHAEELFSARDIQLSFIAPGEEQKLRLGVDVRRDLFLIFKEAVNNAARHAQCSRVEIEMRVDGTSLAMSVRDNGVGFDSNRDSDGQGLASMQRRASELGGSLTIETQHGQGTSVLVKVPVVHVRNFAWR
ncbi:MAG: hypothetical protein C5B55_13635 [Blastocatellia bacterium]|nr:MAG: hypothetical protein C5B55_13635 [Blastocatellia bacterium]